jgi:AcrR family transcriptional regulator
MSAKRRERLRAATIDEIKQAALTQIATEGAASLSLRGVARAIGMSPAGLYRYYNGLDALITELITDAYNDLADAVEATLREPGTTRARFAAATLAYRKWCVHHPHRFLLIFGTPIPGYAAPEGGSTVEANRRIGEAFFTIAAEGWARAEMAVPALSRPVDAGERELAEEISGSVAGFPPELIPTLLGTWAHFHGLVTLEVLNQLQWLYPDPEAFYRGEVERMFEGLARR